MTKFWRVYSGTDGQSKIVEAPPEMRPFVDIEGAHGVGSPLVPATGIAFRSRRPVMCCTGIAPRAGNIPSRCGSGRDRGGRRDDREDRAR